MNCPTLRATLRPLSASPAAAGAAPPLGETGGRPPGSAPGGGILPGSGGIVGRARGAAGAAGPDPAPEQAAKSAISTMANIRIGAGASNTGPDYNTAEAEVLRSGARRVVGERG